MVDIIEEAGDQIEINGGKFERDTFLLSFLLYLMVVAKLTLAVNNSSTDNGVTVTVLSWAYCSA
jgi:hypothetical protein